MVRASSARFPVRPHSSDQPITRSVAKFILTLSVLGILFAGLFPFDFRFPRHGLGYQIRHYFDSSPEPALRADKIQNLLFFVPLGFGLASVVRARRGEPVLRIMLAIVLGGMLSLTVETLQVFLGFRDPTWGDVLMNTIGALLGAIVAIFVADEFLAAISRILARLRPWASARNVTAAFVTYSLLQLAIPFLSVNRGSLENWDSSFPLLVGNENDAGERAWEGSVFSVQLASRAATDLEVAEIHQRGDARPILRDAVIAAYDTIGEAPFEDTMKLLRPLAWVIVDQTASEDEELIHRLSGESAATQPARVGPSRWLRTVAPVAPAVHRIRQSGQFTCIANIAPTEADQHGPARIISLSGGIHERNFSIMHDRESISLRLRTPLLGRDGSAPESLVDHVFSSSNPRQIILTYAHNVMTLYLDGQQAGRMEITPEASLIWRLYPRPGWKVKLNQYGFRSYAIVYRLLVFIPFAALLAAVGSLARMDRRKQLLIAGSTILLMSILLELILGSLTVSGFQSRNLLISIAIATVAFVVLRWKQLFSQTRFI